MIKLNAAQIAARDAEIIRLFSEGVLRRHIAEMMGISVRQVYQVATGRQQSLTGRKARLAAKIASRMSRDRAIIQHYSDGVPREFIAEVFGIHPDTVTDIVAAHGATMSPERMAELNRLRCLRRDILGRTGPRPTKIVLPPEQRRVYENLRNRLGAAAAREALGIAA